VFGTAIIIKAKARAMEAGATAETREGKEDSREFLIAERADAPRCVEAAKITREDNKTAREDSRKDAAAKTAENIE